MMIDKDSPVPYYYQLREILRDQIVTGALAPGAQLPSEAEICRMFGVSRTTVRQALAELLNEGLIRKEKGRGTFVAEPKIQERLVERLTGFYEDMVAQGFHPQTKILEQGLATAPHVVASLLEMEPGSPVIRIRRLRMITNEPLLLVVTYIPQTLCPGLLEEDLEGQSLYAVLEKKYGLHLARGRRYIEAVAATEQEAQLLGVARGAPLVYLRSVTYLTDGRPVEYYEAKHRGDRSRFEVELIRINSFSGEQSSAPPGSELPRAWDITTEARR